MEQLLVLKDAAAQLGLNPSYLRLRIGQGLLAARKLGGRDWYVRRADLKAFDESRRRVGRPVEPPGDVPAEAAREKEREYQREYKRRLRAGLQPGAGKAAKKKTSGKK